MGFRRCGIEDNEKTDECPVIESSSDETIECNEVLTHLVVLVNKIDDKESYNQMHCH